jgi:nucleotide-binding universal stress UspA family protein
VGYAAYGYSNIVSELTQAEHKRVKELLATVATQACGAGLACTTVLADGFAVEEICEVARERDAQLIVVGSHGWGPARRFLSGSVSTGLVHSAPCPVLVVRPGEHPVRHMAAA